MGQGWGWGRCIRNPGGAVLPKWGSDWKAHPGEHGVRRPVGVVVAGGRTNEKGTSLLQNVTVGGREG